MSIDPNDFLMGKGVKSAQFPDGQYGATVGGTIVRRPEVRQQTDFDDGKPKFYDNGDPMMQLVVQVTTSLRDPQSPEDDGVRAFYVKGNMQEAVRNAVRVSGAKGLEVGGTLTITYTGDVPNKRGRGKPAKQYTAAYQPPANAAADAFLNGPARDETPARPAPASQPTVVNAAPAGTTPQVATMPAGIDLSALDPATRALVEQSMSQQGSPVPF